MRLVPDDMLLGMKSVIRRNLKFEELPEHIRSYFVRPFEDYDADSRYLNEHYEELLRTYPEEYVFIRDAEVVGHGPVMSEVLADLECRGIDRRMLPHRYFSTRPQNLIL